MADNAPPPSTPAMGAVSRVTGLGVSPSGAWFAWGLIAGLLLAGASVYLIRKKL